MVNPKKIKSVDRIVKELANYPVVGVVNMENLPAMQLQKMKRSLWGKAELTMARKKLLARALEMSEIAMHNLPASARSKPAISEHAQEHAPAVLDKTKNQTLISLTERFRGMPALILTRENPFKLQALLQKSKSAASAKSGQIAPQDIWIKAGPTGFTPGPIISELSGAGLKTGVEAGKIVIKEDKLLVKEGQAITQKQSDLLKKMDVKPMEIGLNLVAVWENGFIFEAKHLAIDEKAVSAQFTQAHSEAFNLAVEMAYFSRETVDTLLAKAFREAKAVALEGNVLADAVLGEVLAKAEAQAAALQEKVE